MTPADDMYLVLHGRASSEDDAIAKARLIAQQMGQEVHVYKRIAVVRPTTSIEVERGG